ncbi:MAG: glycosyltransferase [Spirochaetes bacterium]|nr:glycosyltransferase [Spirochaetota bacterium]
MEKIKTYKMDMHVHSIFSERPSELLLKFLGTRESYVDPFKLFKFAKEKGMDFITITDHNKIDGIIKLKEKYPEETILGVEATTYFPEDGTKIHILLYDFEPYLFEKIDTIRSDIYKLREFIFENNIFYSVAHPLYSINKKLNLNHFEKLILLFDNFEVVNGGRNLDVNNITEKFFNNLNEELIYNLIRKHKIKPYSKNAHKKIFTAGSDDHTGLFIGTSYNYIRSSENLKITIKDFIETVKSGGSQFEGKSVDFESHAFQILKISFDFYKSKYLQKKDENIFNEKNEFNLFNNLNNNKVYEENKDLLYNKNNKKRDYINLLLKTFDKIIFEKRKLSLKEYIFLRRYLTKNKNKNKKINIKIIEFLLKINRLKNYDPLIVSYELFRSISNIIDILIKSFLESITTSSNLIKTNLLLFIEKLISSLVTFALSIPYITSISHIWQDRKIIDELINKYFFHEKKEFKKIAWFTDTLIDLNGVSVTLRNIGEFSKIKNRELFFVTSIKKEDYERNNFNFNIINFEPIFSFRSDIYKTFEVKFPSIMKIIKEVYDMNPDEIIISTPGPVGLTGLLLSKILNIPSKMVFHTDFSKEASEILGDKKISDIIDYILKIIYNLSDHILVNTYEYIKILKDKGFNSDKMSLFRRGIDLSKFYKINKENNKMINNLEIKNNDFILLYTGRISKDKNLDFILEVFEELKNSKYLKEKDITLKFIIAGDGPYLDELKNKYKSFREIYFLGKIENKNLPELYSLANLFVFPSVTDTFGMSVLEAQACGLPVLTSNIGGPKEIIINNETGYSLKIDKNLWKRKIIYLIDDKINNNSLLLNYLSKNALTHVQEKYDIEKVIDYYFRKENNRIKLKIIKDKVKINKYKIKIKNNFTNKSYKIHQIQF